MNPDRNVRRLESLLYTSGVGTILFSLWSVLRQIEDLYRVLQEMYANMELEYLNSKTAYMIVGCIIFLITLIFAFLYIYIGRKAMLVSLGKSKSKGYLILAVILLVTSFYAYFEGVSLQMEDIILFLIDVTSNIILLEVVVFSVLLKRLRG